MIYEPCNIGWFGVKENFKFVTTPHSRLSGINELAIIYDKTLLFKISGEKFTTTYSW